MFIECFVILKAMVRLGISFYELEDAYVDVLKCSKIRPDQKCLIIKLYRNNLIMLKNYLMSTMENSIANKYKYINSVWN